MARKPFEFEADDDDFLAPILGQSKASFSPTPSGGPVPPNSGIVPKSVQKRIALQTEPFPEEMVTESKPSVISEPVLAKLAQSEPDLVARYREKMAASNQGMEDAQKTQDVATYGNVFGKIANDFGNSQKDDTIYRNSWNKMGNAPQIERAERKEYDGSVITALGNQAVSRAKDARATSEQEFMTVEKLADMQLSRQDQQTARDDQQTARDRLMKERDPASAESQAARDYLKKVAPSATSMSNFDKLSAAQIDKIAPSLYQAYNAEEQRKSASADRSESREMRAALSGQARSDKAAAQASKDSEKMEQLRIGNLGYAQTADDAKQLKTGMESKANFDGKLDELIALRTKHNGGALFNREDVARANQLSKDLLLSYKDMAKLGVLSASDEAILNKIIPSDPLEYNSPIAALQGQDPILENMKKFKADAEKDFQTKINGRLRREGRNTSPTQSSGNAAKGGIVHGSNLPD